MPQKQALDREVKTNRVQRYLFGGIRVREAVHTTSDAHPVFHSVRRFQYANHTFHHKLEAAGMTQSMSGVVYCIDNG